MKSVGKAIFQGDAVDASEYMTHSTIEIRSRHGERVVSIFIIRLGTPFYARARDSGLRLPVRRSRPPRNSYLATTCNLNLRG
jgi:hypothetical protein